MELNNNESYCEIKDKKEYTEKVRRWNDNTEASGSEMGEDIEKLLNNDAYLKEELERIDGNAVTAADKGVAGGVAALGTDGKLAQHVDYSKVDNVPAPVWNDVTEKPNNYPPSYHNHAKSEVGLWNVDNTADANKSVKYASGAGDADTVDGKHAAAFAAASHTHNYAAADHTHNYAAANHTHNYAGSSSAGGEANSATKLATARTIRTNLASTGTASFDGSGNVTPGVTGVLAVGNGGTGNNTGYVRAGQKDGTTIGSDATAEGYNTTASARECHAEGYYTVASGSHAHAEGIETTASGNSSHAEGGSTTFNGTKVYTVASGNHAHAEGCGTTASGSYSHAGGFSTIASSYAQTSIGQFNVQYGTSATALNSYFIVGNGSSAARSNAFRVHSDGTPYGKKAYNTSGADYAEYFEWMDGNTENEDRRGYFVTLDGDKIKIASSLDEYILGIISGKPSVIGNSDPDGWHSAFLCDDFGNFVMQKTKEKQTITQMEEIHETYIDENGNEAARMIPQEITEEIWVDVDSYVMSPDYNEEQPYIPRSERSEWAAVGMLGVLRVRDDGTCQVNGYCTVADGGIATSSKTGWRVISRLTDNIIKIVFQ